MVSLRFWPVRARSLCWVKTLAWPNAEREDDRRSATAPKDLGKHIGRWKK
jgi:hypothetical protein